MTRLVPSAATHATLACSLMAASGFAGLAYQIVWTQQSTHWLGHESAAVLAVVAAFFGGLALGALLFGSRIERSARPHRWYAGCEIAIGAWSLALALLLEPAATALLELIGPRPSVLWHWCVAFIGTALLLLPATMAMGATLPAMQRTLAASRRPGTAIGALYAANTLGAVAGVLGAAFWLVPRLGLQGTAALCAALNLVCALAALSLRPIAQPPVAARSTITAAPLSLLAATGVLGIGYEVLVVRALSQVAENTVYTFAILLAVYLIGTSVGAAAYARWLAQRTDTDRLRDRLLQGLAIACLIGIALLAGADEGKAWLQQALGASMTAALTAEALLGAAAFLPPTVLMGALFSHLAAEAIRAGATFGRALGINTLGAAAAPLLFGVLLLPLIGLKLALLLIALGYLSLVARQRWLTAAQALPSTAVVAAIVWLPPLLAIEVPEDGRLVAHIEGIMASVTVVTNAEDVATLHINNRQQEGSSATLIADARQALLPVLLHPAPHRALFLGVGTGLTASSATLDPALEVDAVELVPEVIDAAAHFRQARAPEADDSRLHLLSADARRFLRATDTRYDIIVADNFHPARSGSGSLYTIEHFALVQARLAQGGLFCQWLPLHQLDMDTLRSIVRTFVAVYPHATAVLATHSLDTPVLGLISRRDGEQFDLHAVRARLDANARTLDAFGVRDDLALLGTFVAGPRALAHFAADAALNTDDRPVVSYRAPRITYAPDSSPRDRLAAVLQVFYVDPRELLGSTVDAAWQARLSAYWTARDRFIDAGRAVHPASDVREMLEQVREPLLAVLKTSPDFRPAYDPLLRMATALDAIDPAAARALLTDLQRIQPLRPEAGELLQRIASSMPR